MLSSIRNAHNVASNEQLVLLIFEKAITLMWEAREKLSEDRKIETVDTLHMVRRLFMELQAFWTKKVGTCQGLTPVVYLYFKRSIYSV